MIPVPPKLVRRAVLAPLVLAAEAAVILASPVLALIGLLMAPIAGGTRALRTVAITAGYCVRHVGATFACLGLWLSGRGRAEDAHYAVLRWFVNGIYRTMVRRARVEVRTTESEAAEAVLSGERPVVVLSRHAGEGDSLLVLHLLLCRHRRRPRVVLHEALRLDPLIDALGTRLPNRFVDPRGGDTEVEIAAMARDLDDNGAVLIFPEGGNFSRARRERGIERLEHAGHAEEAAWARAMEHVSAPRPGGALAALEAAPDADVIFVGHHGVPIGARDVWRRLPEPQTIEVRLWLVPAADVPEDRDAQIDWLFEQWRTLDAWVSERDG